MNINANNLPGGGIQDFPLPLKFFELVKSIFQTLLTSVDSDWGYFPECELEELHDYFQVFLLALTKSVNNGTVKYRSDRSAGLTDLLNALICLTYH